MLDRMTIRKQSQCSARQSLSPSVNLYVMELRVLFGGHGTIEVQY
jgi:hypothetical protein